MINSVILIQAAVAALKAIDICFNNLTLPQVPNGSNPNYLNIAFTLTEYFIDKMIKPVMAREQY